MKIRIHNANIDVIVEGEYQHEIFQKFLDEHPEERHNTVFVEIVELPKTPWTAEELLDHLRQGHI